MAMEDQCQDCQPVSSSASVGDFDTPSTETDPPAADAGAENSTKDSATETSAPANLSDIKALLQKLNEAVQEKEKSIASSAGSKGVLCEIKSLVQKVSRDGQTEVVDKGTYLLSADNKEYSEYALVAKQIYDEKARLDKTVLEINSPQLLGLLKKTVTYYPSEPLQFDKQASFDSPFTLINQYKSELKAEADASDDKTTKSHVELLLNFIQSEAGEKAQKRQTLINDGLISFDALWTIFKPGDLLYSRNYGHDRLYKLQKADYVDSKCPRGWYFQASCEYSSCDGERAGTSSTNISIWEKQEFVGSNPSKISTLSLFPLKFLQADRQEPLKAELTARGKKYLEIVGVQTFDYNGIHLYLKQPPWDYYDERAMYDGTWLPRSATSRIVVDAKTFVEELKNQEEKVANRSEIEDGKADKKSGKENYTYQSLDVDPMLCPPYVYGHSLDMDKSWCRFFITNLKPVPWQKNAMDQLILPDAQRRLVQSLVSSHRFPDQARDEVNLKGKGLIILLHGTPGSGKTMTAEMVAEHTKRPLLKISTGELGSWGERISYELKKLLTYASIWHAIVLIDEADVFLEARKSGPEQFEQNNLVAVFLRQLEYFQGILFLTSNRVQVFDAAIRSRIHLALEYHAPDLHRRGLLWKQDLAEVPTDEIGFDIEEAIHFLEKPEMNGREISNAVNTARTLASGENGKLKVEHLETVLLVWQSFQDSLSRIQKEDGVEK